jgi:hypothetical protein
LGRLIRALLKHPTKQKKKNFIKNYKLIIDKLKFNITGLEKQVMSPRNENESDTITLKTTLLMKN